MGNRFQRSWEVARESYEVLRANPALAIFPVLSGAATLLVSIPFLTVLALALIGMREHPHAWGPVQYLVTAAMYFVNYFVVVFFNSALVACANENLQGRPTTVGFGFKAASARLPQILGWAAIASTVGMILRMISERGGIIGSIVSSLFGLAWNFAVFFVVPNLILEGESPIQAVKSSASMIKQTWGERLILGAGVGTVIGLIMLLAIIPIVGAIVLAASDMVILAVVIAILGVLAMCVVGAIGSAMTTIFQTALYLYCRTGGVPAGFSIPSLQGAFAQKTKSGLFGR